MANQKLTQDELNQLQELQQKNAALVQELGSISLAEINLDGRKEKAEEFLAELKQAETDLVKSLEDTYGVGSIDLQAGEFIPAPKSEEAPAKAEVEPEVLKAVMRYTNNNQSKAATALGLNRATLRKKLHRYNIIKKS